jgi:hypothetical protein
MESKSKDQPPRDAKSTEYDVGADIVLSKLPPIVALKLERINTQYHQLRENYPTSSSPPIGEDDKLVQTAYDILRIFHPRFGLEDGLSPQDREAIQSSYRPAQLLASDFLDLGTPPFTGSTIGEFMRWRRMEQGKPEEALILGLEELYQYHLPEMKFQVECINRTWNTIQKIWKDFHKVFRAWEVQNADPTLYAGNEPDAAELAANILQTLCELRDDVSDEEASFLVEVFSHVIATCIKFLNDCYGTSNPIKTLIEKHIEDFQYPGPLEGRLGATTTDSVKVAEDCLKDLRKRDQSNTFEVPIQPNKHPMRQMAPPSGYPWYGRTANQVFRDNF